MFNNVMNQSIEIFAGLSLAQEIILLAVATVVVTATVSLAIRLVCKAFRKETSADRRRAAHRSLMNHTPRGSWINSNTRSNFR